MSLNRRRWTYVHIVEIRTISDGFNCLGAGCKFRRKLELVQIKTYTRGAISRGLQHVRPDTMRVSSYRFGARTSVRPPS